MLKVLSKNGRREEKELRVILSVSRWHWRQQWKKTKLTDLKKMMPWQWQKVKQTSDPHLSQIVFHHVDCCRQWVTLLPLSTSLRKILHFPLFAHAIMSCHSENSKYFGKRVSLSWIQDLTVTECRIPKISHRDFLMATQPTHQHIGKHWA